jgi:hypothetical protein
LVEEKRQASFPTSDSSYVVVFPTSYSERRRFMKKTLSAVTTVVGAAGLIFLGYIVVASLPDMGRYIKISSM